jgi:hypothetical protein
MIKILFFFFGLHKKKIFIQNISFKVLKNLLKNKMFSKKNIKFPHFEEILVTIFIPEINN